MDVVVSQELLGEEAEADISEWLVPDGANVTKGQPIAELETAKVRVEILAPEGGTLRIVVAAGSVIEPGALVAKIV
jgi:pyruvate dehydrogenase E2 component (dihydrolipoamide acetyltransferase)